jgi:hypothetical protein
VQIAEQHHRHSGLKLLEQISDEVNARATAFYAVSCRADSRLALATEQASVVHRAVRRRNTTRGSPKASSERKAVVLFSPIF